ncbi:MAG: hypothetical protein Q4B88_02835 [Moraxella sp.]|nr:hypothetical protein [Moraxella sp.]
MSKLTLIISHNAIDDIEKSRYFKHHLIYQNPFIYSRMVNNVMVNDKLNGEFLAFLKNLNKPIYFAVGELTHNQTELEFALQLLKEHNLNHCQILTDDLIVLPKQIYQI